MPPPCVSIIRYPSNDSEEVASCTMLFKQICMVLELQSSYVKLGTQSALFLDAFKKQQAFLRREPVAPMDCPPFMWRGTHEQEAVTSAPNDFWKEISQDTMIKNFYEPEDVTKSAEGIISKKVLDTTSKGDGCHAALCIVFPVGEACPISLSSKASEEVEAVRLAVNFKAGQCSKKLDEAAKLIHDKSRPIANALDSFPHGRAILASALLKAQKADQQSSRTSTAQADLEEAVEKFPAASATDRFEGIGKQLMVLFDEHAEFDNVSKAAIVSWAQPHFDKLHDKMAKLYKEEVLPHLQAMDVDMDAIPTPSFQLQETLPRLAATLGAFDKAQQASNGFLLPAALVNKRAVVADLVGVVLTMSKCGDAIASEYLDNELAGRLTIVPEEFHEDKFRGALGGSIDWPNFLKKFREAKVFKKCLEFLTKDVAPIAGEVKNNMDKILAVKVFNTFEESKLIELKDLVSESMEQKAKQIEEFAIKAGDRQLRTQITQLRRVMLLMRAALQVAQWTTNAKDPKEVLAMTEQNIIIVSRLRTAVRGARLQMTELPMIFKPEGTGTHMSTFDQNDLAIVIIEFIDAVTSSLNSLQQSWHTDIKAAAEKIKKFTPEYTLESLLEKEVTARLLSNSNFADLGIVSNQMFQTLHVAACHLLKIGVGTVPTRYTCSTFKHFIFVALSNISYL